MIDYEESFWSLSCGLRKSAWVRLWTRDMPSRNVESARLDSGECWNVARLIQESPEAEFAFRSLLLFAEGDCRKRLGVNPLLIDIDIDLKTQEAADGQLERVKAYADERNWLYSVYHSGVGYHVEVDPVSVDGQAFGDWLDYAHRGHRLETG